MTTNQFTLTDADKEYFLHIVPSYSNNLQAEQFPSESELRDWITTVSNSQASSLDHLVFMKMRIQVNSTHTIATNNDRMTLGSANDENVAENTASNVDMEASLRQDITENHRKVVNLLNREFEELRNVAQILSNNLSMTYTIKSPSFTLSLTPPTMALQNKDKCITFLFFNKFYRALFSFLFLINFTKSFFPSFFLNFFYKVFLPFP